MIFIKFMFVSVMLCLLVACGGGGSSSPASSTPAVSSTQTASSTPAALSSSAAAELSSSSTTSSISSMAASSNASSALAFTLTSDNFIADAVVPNTLTCVNGDHSPNLQWSIVSEDIKSFAVIIDDPDANAMFGRTWVHWNVYHIGADVRQLAESASLTAMPVNSVEGTTDFGSAKYLGPCPPSGSGVHHYHFAVYALNKAAITVDLAHSITRSVFEEQHLSDIIQKVEIIGTFSR